MDRDEAIREMCELVPGLKTGMLLDEANTLIMKRHVEILQECNRILDEMKCLLKKETD